MVAAAGYRVVSALPARLVPTWLQVLRWKYRPVWVPVAALGRKHGPPGGSRESGKDLNAQLRRAFVVDGDWDTPGRTLQQPTSRERLEELIESMTRDGFVHPATSTLAARQGGIQVCVAGDGELVIFNEGHHRISAARIAGVEKVPVFIRGIHREWASSQLGPKTKYSTADLDCLVARIERGPIGVDDAAALSPDTPA